MDISLLHTGEDGGHIDLPHTNIGGLGTKIIVKFELAEVPTESVILLEGRLAGNGWDSSNDRGYIEITTSCVLNSAYQGAILTLDGVQYAGTPLQINKVYTLEIDRTATAPVSSFLGRIGARYAVNGSSWHAFKGYIHHLEIQGPTSQLNIKYITNTVGLSVPRSDIIPNTAEIVHSQDALSMSGNGWNIDSVNKSATKTGSGWNRLYITEAYWPPPVYRVSFNLDAIGTNVFRLYYNCRNNIQHQIDLDTLGPYECFFEVGKDGRAYFDTSGSGSSISNLEVTRVNDGIIHVGDSTTAWRAVPFVTT